MDGPSRSLDKTVTFTVLVTGANSGLGFAICCRLIDEFLFTRPPAQTLHLLFSTRDARKSADTLQRLTTYAQNTLRRGAQGSRPDSGVPLERRLKIEGVLVDLTKLRTVKALADHLLTRGGGLDAVIWNAGISGWKGPNWPKAVWDVCTGLVQATTYPTYMIPDVGAIAGQQLASTTELGSEVATEPPLGQVFLANVFGHYMLTHWLSPLFMPSSRIIWISSISAVSSTFSPDDIQGLRSSVAYEGSKRLTDYLVLTSELPSTRRYVSSFLPPLKSTSTPAAEAESERGGRPKLILTHPGVIATSIADLHWLPGFFMLLAFYLARLLGSPWHPVDAYKGAISAAFAALAPPDQLTDYEDRDGKGKWGSSTGVYGDERVARTEVEGWGYCGVVGKVPRGSLTGKTGEYAGRKETTREMREQFEEVGANMWREMEALRQEWEERLRLEAAKV